MVRALWDRILHQNGTGMRRDTRLRPVTKLRPACEPMDGRQLPSTLAPASIAELSPPSPAAVANAAAILDSLAPRAFAQLERNLPRAEQHSRVTPTQANQLAQDEATIIRGIESSGLIPSIVSEYVSQVQDLVALSFIEKAEASMDWLDQEEALDGCIGGTKVNPQIIHRTIEQMFAIANTAQVSSEQYVIMQGDLNALEKRVAADPNISLGNGSNISDPVDVYYEGQVSQFVHGSDLTA